MEWREFAVTVSSQGEEAVADLFYQLGCPGVSIEDQELLRSYIESGEWDYHVFGEIIRTGTSVVKGYFPVNEELVQKVEALEEGLKQLLEKFPDWVILMTRNSLMEEDWATAWKAFYKPVKIGKRFLIKPSWEMVEVNSDDVILELDPGMAFGTGTHPTTTLCLRVMEDVVKEGQRVYDLGTGSGILAIAAAKLGAEVEAVDLDPVAVKVAQENVILNNVSEQVRVLRGDLGTVLREKADVVIANIIADVIIALLPDLARILKEDGEFIASGIIDARSQEVEEKMVVKGFTVIERREDSGWILLRARWTNRASL